MAKQVDELEQRRQQSDKFGHRSLGRMSKNSGASSRVVTVRMQLNREQIIKLKMKCVDNDCTMPFYVKQLILTAIS